MTGGGEGVVVAMSGGVDSSVAAALLLQQGRRVIGATLVMHPCGEDTEPPRCCGDGAVDSARAVAVALGIPHYAIPCADLFEREVLGPAWDEYDRGRTPSPCVHCNARIKLTLLMDLALELGAAHVATGHYARIVRDGGAFIARGADRDKDQSYFLFTLTEKQREGVLFPLGELTKAEVRAIAAGRSFASARRPESQDACLAVEGGGFAEALRRRFRAAARPGPVVDRRGIELGRHGGIHNYTVGQRKGLGIAVGRRAYVSGIDASRAAVVLTDEPADLDASGLVASRAVWHGGAPAPRFECAAQIRYRHAPAVASVAVEGDTVEVRFAEPQRAAAPGQAVVFYDGDRVIGGAWIDGPA